MGAGPAPRASIGTSVLFNSYLFLFVFFPFVVAGFFALGRWAGQAPAIWFLLMASLIFYGWPAPEYVLLIGASIGINYWFGRALARRGGGLLLACAIGVNLAALAYFKYANFISGNIEALSGYRLLGAPVALPTGISFFTFTQIAYLVDVAGRQASEYRFAPYALFVSYFPHLIAGPILHHRDLIPQFDRPSTFRLRLPHVVTALTFFSIGLTKKVLADSMAPFVSEIFHMAASGDAHISLLDAWSGAIGYAFQLYLDFSGYSDMAVGLSRVFGVSLPYNFLSPYQAPDIIEFWRRWNISLSNFLRDYLYIPLGGNRLGPRRRYLNLMLTMLLGGLWHGASWTFVLWGGIHGAYLLVNHAFRALWPRAGTGVSRLGPALTFLCVVLAWVPFRAESLSASLRLWQAMFGANAFNKTDVLFQAALGPLGDLLSLFGYVSTRGANRTWLVFLMLVMFTAPNSVEIAEGTWRTRQVRHWLMPKPGYRLSPVFGALLGLMFGACLGFLGAPSEFLYFRF
jgi:alginate O-acetyltransferase complex protein AlgI